MHPKSTPLTKTCQRCGDEFAVNKPYKLASQKYCSVACRLDALHDSNRGELSTSWQPRVTIHCEWCTAPMELTPSQARQRRFCSESCRREWISTQTGKNNPNYKPQVEKRCEQCGALYQLPPSHAAKSKYCSRACSAKSHGAKVSGRLNANWKPKIVLFCGYCNQPFDVVPSEQAIKKYCSKECDSAARRLVTGKDHPLYRPKVRMVCEVCGAPRMVKPSLVSRFRACSKRCAASLADHRSSSLEETAARILDALGERYERQARFRWYLVDFYLPDRNLVIECDGDYWHSLPKQQRIDKAKDTYLRNRGVAVARIPEHVIKDDALSAIRGVLHANPPVA